MNFKKLFYIKYSLITHIDNNEYTPNREDLLSKILEKSITKSKKSLEIRDNESKMFDELNNLDLNFVYSKENFSNFLNFNIDQLAHDQEAFNPDLSKNNLTKLDENLFDEFKSDAFQTENKNLNDLKIKNEKSDFTNNEYKSFNEPSKPNINQNLSALGYEFSKKIQIVNSKMTYDEDLQINKDEDFLKNICDKRIFKKMNVSKIFENICFIITLIFILYYIYIYILVRLISSTLQQKRFS